MILTAAFWKAAAERAAKSFGQGFVATFGLATVASTAELVTRVEFAALAGLGTAVLSIATSLASAHFGDSDGPSLGGEVLEGEAL